VWQQVSQEQNMVNIGQAAAFSGVSAKMIRYYEQIGLIPQAERSAAGYRTYSTQDAHSLRFIRRARDLGFPVEQIAELLTLWNDRGRASADVKAVALAHVAGLRTRIAELEAMAQTLEHLAEHCHGNDRPDCPIIADLAEQTDAAAAVPDTVAPHRAPRFGTDGPLASRRRTAK
jgi:Cu(I)-responsive transcriptional regulator